MTLTAFILLGLAGLGVFGLALWIRKTLGL